MQSIGGIMATEIDPLSQMVGGLMAQASDLSRQMTDLRSEVVTNRSYNQTWRDEWRKALEELHVELRTVKHDYRSAEQASIALNSRLGKIDERLTEIERVVTVWRARATVIGATAVGFGSIAGYIASLVTTHFWGK
jgi:chromosome segregation ATPase